MASIINKRCGRHWGCRRELSDAVPGLHFDVCYYHGIEYAIKHRLQRFEPGAQGPYKISRGFDPATTYSTHWLRHPDFHRAIEQYVEREGQTVEQYRRELADSTAYREET